MPAPTPIPSSRLLAAFVFSWLAMACGVTPPAASPASTAASPGPDALLESAGAATGEAESTDSDPEPPPLMPFGVPECDGFITKYVACVEQRVPAEQRPRLIDELHEQRAKWRELAKMDQGRLAVGLSCRGVAQRLKGDLTVDYGCEF